MRRRVVVKTKDLHSGEVKIVPLGKKTSLGVFNIEGRFYALKNLCPHQGGPLCQGRLRPLIVSDGPYQVSYQRESEILRCPWHNWEFDIKTGEALCNPRVRVRTYPVTVEGDKLVVSLDLD